MEMRIKDGKTIPQLIKAVHGGFCVIDELPSKVRRSVAAGVQELVNAEEKAAAEKEKADKKKKKKPTPMKAGPKPPAKEKEKE